MAKIRILSWNIRTFGAHAPSAPVIRGILEQILSSRADVVCVQELQSGTGVGARIGSPVVGTAVVAIFSLHLALLNPG